MDLAINDAFQYFYERQHFDATEQVYLSMRIDEPFSTWVKTAELQNVAQSTDQPRSAEGMVDTLTLVTPGSGYAPSSDLMVCRDYRRNWNGLEGHPRVTLAQRPVV